MGLASISARRSAGLHTVVLVADHLGPSGWGICGLGARLTPVFLWLVHLLFFCCARWSRSRPPRIIQRLFGIFAFLDVPLVFGSIRCGDQHPQPVGWRFGIRFWTPPFFLVHRWRFYVAGSSQLHGRWRQRVHRNVGPKPDPNRHHPVRMLGTHQRMANNHGTSRNAKIEAPE